VATRETTTKMVPNELADKVAEYGRAGQPWYNGLERLIEEAESGAE